MFGGIAIAGNLLCIASTDARGRLYLFDLDEGRLASRWSWDAGDGGPSDAGGVAFDRDYNIYVADTRCDLVRGFTAFGRPVRTFGAPHERAPGAAQRDRRGRLDRPRAVAVHGEVLHVACGERWLVRGVQRFRLDGSVLPPLRAFGDAEERFGAPRGIHASAAGIFVADTLHGVVQRFRIDGTYVARIATAPRPEEVSRPVAVLPLPGSREVLILDQGDEPGLHRVSLDGRHAEPPREDGGIEHPVALAADERGRVHVLDHDGERVVRIGADLRVEREIADLREYGL
jgi:hypothetical protein